MTESQESKQKAKIPPIVIIVAVIAIIGTFAEWIASAPVEPVRVQYRVTTGSAGAVDISYENDTGNTEERAGTRLSSTGTWRQTISVEPGTYVQVTARADGPMDWVKCEILYDGEIAETATATGSNGRARCSGFAGED